MGTILGNKVHWKSKLWNYVINVGFPFLNSSMKDKFVKIWLIFDMEKWLWNSKLCSICLTFKIEKNQRPIIIFYKPSWSWGQHYSSLNSAKLSWKSEVMLHTVRFIRLSKLEGPYFFHACSFGLFQGLPWNFYFKIKLSWSKMYQIILKLIFFRE